MSHLHIPDGVLPIWLWLSGLLLMTLLLAAALSSARRKDLRRRLPLLAFTAALMLIGMSLEIVPIAYHLNLSVLAGILLGPAMAFIASFLVNFMLGLVGHGGLTVVGLNTLIVGLETLSGYWLFRLFSRFLKPALAAGISVVITLFLTTSLVIGVVALARLNPAEMGEAFQSGEWKEKGLLSFPGGEGHHHQEEAAGHGRSPISLLTFAAGAYLLGSIGWVLEALMVASIVHFVKQVKPEMISP
ncbi:MAG: energy-coupling factor ABC transporter permease [candidate division NC10 bacterium]|nr:energy-coupling factor ABC transporter permease [candidate division NC10 bacterium]